MYLKFCHAIYMLDSINPEKALMSSYFVDEN